MAASTPPTIMQPIETQYETGCQLLAAGRIEHALADFCRLLESCPDALDDVTAAFGDRITRHRGFAALRKQAESGPTTAAHWALAARLARDIGDVNEAVGWAEKAAKAQPDRASWWFELGESLLLCGGLRRAATAYRRCLAVDPQHRMAQCRLQVLGGRRWRGVARLLARIPLVRRLLRRLVWSGGRLHVLETRGQSAVAHQMRWAQALEQGSALLLLPHPPKEQEPADFEQSLERNPPPFWQWFGTLGIEKGIRRVLDVGCGNGFAAEHFLRRGLEVVGVTCNPHEKSECLGRGLTVIEDDFHFLRVPDDSFDLVFSSHSLEHSIAHIFALWEWKRVIRAGGYIMIVIPLPFEQDARAVAREHYDPATDTIDFGRSGEKAPSPQEVRADHSAYGIGGHPVVCNYWQLRRLFRLVDLELVAETVEDPSAGRLLGVEHINGQRPIDPTRPVNGMFLLRKPGGTSSRI